MVVVAVVVAAAIVTLEVGDIHVHVQIVANTVAAVVVGYLEHAELLALCVHVVAVAVDDNMAFVLYS